MRVERYQEDDMRTAMAKVRAELGKDAVIISSRRVDGRTEIMAARDFDSDKLEAEIKKLSGREAAPGTAPDTEVKKKDHVWKILSEEKENVTQTQPSLIDMQEELARLRKLFEGELAQLAWRDVGNRQPNRLALLSRMEEADISRDICSKIIEKVLPCDDLELGWSRILRILSRVIKISEQDVLSDGGVIALLGPTGVGKTTTAAKIAAQFAIRHGQQQVAFITTDSSRVGGQEQLISLGSILGIPVQIVNNREEMQKTLESFSERKLVIIDTAGISQRDTSLLEQLETLKNDKVKIHSHLVLAATAQESVINETIKAFSSIDLTAAIITKTDECGSIGAVLSGLIRNKLPASFVGNGQQVPEDLLVAQANIFINKITESYDETRKKIKKTKIRKKRPVNV